MVRHISSSPIPTPPVSSPSGSQTSLATQTLYRQTLYHTSPTVAFEEAFELEIPDEDAEKITTVKDAVD